jgi:hypothetical protein
MDGEGGVGIILGISNRAVIIVAEVLTRASFSFLH